MLSTKSKWNCTLEVKEGQNNLLKIKKMENIGISGSCNDF